MCSVGSAMTVVSNSSRPMINEPRVGHNQPYGVWGAGLAAGAPHTMPYLDGLTKVRRFASTCNNACTGPMMPAAAAMPALSGMAVMA